MATIQEVLYGKIVSLYYIAQPLVKKDPKSSTKVEKEVTTRIFLELFETYKRLDDDTKLIVRVGIDDEAFNLLLNRFDENIEKELIAKNLFENNYEL